MSENMNSIYLSKITDEHINTTISTFGWVTSIRSGGRVGTFITLYFGYSTIKCLFPPNVKLTPHSSVRIVGKVVKNMGRDNFKFEIQVTSFDIYCEAPSFPLNSESLAFTKLELGHLALQTTERIHFLRARSELLRFIREFYHGNEYCEVTPPTLVQTQVEGGSTLFSLDYYDQKAYLTQSSQLYLETVVPATHKAFCVMPSYRAEKFNTTRHISEYTHVEAEIADTSFEGLLKEIEDLLTHVVLSFTKRMNDLEIPVKDFDLTFNRITYEDAIIKLKEENIFKDKELNTSYTYGDDIADRDEVMLVKLLGNRPTFLVNFPADHKPFYCRKMDDDPEKTESVDLLWPGIGEIVGGSMRAEKHDEIIEGFKRENIDSKPYYWYTDLRLFGASKHGGYGMGFERLLMSLMDYDTINKACLYPRFPSRCQP